MKIKIDYKFRNEEERDLLARTLQSMGQGMLEVSRLLYTADRLTPGDKKRALKYWEKAKRLHKELMSTRVPLLMNMPLLDSRLKKATRKLIVRGLMRLDDNDAYKGNMAAMGQTLERVGTAFKKFGLVVARIPVQSLPVPGRPRWR